MTSRLSSMIGGAPRLTPTRVAITGGVLALLSLLGNNAGLAVIIASLVIPAAGLVELSNRDLFEREPRWSTPVMLLCGVGVGIVMATIGAMVAAEWWIDGAPLHVGAAGFGGAAADREGAPGVLVLLFNGIVLPALGVIVAAMAPYAMRRYPVFRNEVMDGFTLGAATGAGLATGTTIVFVWPIISGGSASGGSVADWTAMLIGVLVTRPIIFALAVAFICSGIWHVPMSQRSADLFLPAGVGLGSVIVFIFGDLLIQPSGTRAELAWHVVIAATLVVASRFVLKRALHQDRLAQPVTAERVICPNCGSSTPNGLFCAKCGAPLTDQPDNNEFTAAGEDEIEYMPEAEPQTPILPADETPRQV